MWLHRVLHKNLLIGIFSDSSLVLYIFCISADSGLQTAVGAYYLSANEISIF